MRDCYCSDCLRCNGHLNKLNRELKQANKRIAELEADAKVEREHITIEAVQSVIDYIDEFEGFVDLKVVRSELGELILRATGDYWEQGE